MAKNTNVSESTNVHGGNVTIGKDVTGGSKFISTDEMTDEQRAAFDEHVRVAKRRHGRIIVPKIRVTK